MSEPEIATKNLAALQSNNPLLYRQILAVTDLDKHSGFRYTGVAIARNGSPVPVYPDGSASHSLFNPEQEASNLIDTVTETGFAFFAGIGGAFHIRDFLSRDSSRACIASEASAESLASLLRSIDLSDIIADSRVSIVVDCRAASSERALDSRYLPALHGNFRFIPLRSWQERNRQSCECYGKLVEASLSRISADYSVQAHFGKIWLRNSLINLALASKIQGSVPLVDPRKKAIVVAAGPGLEKELERIKRSRDRLVLFSTDTAWNTLADSGIIPDFFISIDAQAVSSSHVMRTFDKSMTVILDLCGNPAIARKAHEDGASVIFASGMHPLARVAALFSPLPLINTASGTVTLSAIDAAFALGFSDIESIGADFAYTGGKPYARGTYLSHTFGSTGTRLLPMETLFSTLMFRTPVGTRSDSGTITYTTETLDRYARSFSDYQGKNRWKPSDFALFPYGEFLAKYREELQALLSVTRPDTEMLYSILPLAAWLSRSGRYNRGVKYTDGKPQNKLAGVIELALELIAGYTVES